MQKLILRTAVCLSILMPFKAMAAEEDWVVERATAQVKYSTDKATWKAVKVGMTIPNGAWMSTGPRGRALLQRGVESVNFHPGTMASITTNSRHQTEVVQPTGTLDLDIEKRSAPHTQVDTPFLAAVVKGTKFSVTVSKKTAAVSVTRGLVNVRSLQSAQQADVGPGQSASVGSGGSMQTSGKAAAPTINRVTSIFGFLGVPTTSALAAPAAPAEATTGTATSSAASSSEASAGATAGQSSNNGKGGGDGGRGSGSGGGSGESRDKPGDRNGKEGMDGPGNSPDAGNGPEGAGKGPAGAGKDHNDAKGHDIANGSGQNNSKGTHGKGPGKSGGHGENADRPDNGGHATDADNGDHAGEGRDGKGDNKGQSKAKGHDK